MRRAMEYATGLGVVLAEHCEDASLAGGGQMNEGEWSSRLGIPGQPAEAEELMALKPLAASADIVDLLLAAVTYEAHGVYEEALALYVQLAEKLPAEAGVTELEAGTELLPPIVTVEVEDGAPPQRTLLKNA